MGLLIGKQGRNIKQLKQDSGAEIFVHEAPLREDIQVLQICGKIYYFALNLLYILYDHMK